jgi:hypothetical protein
MVVDTPGGRIHVQWDCTASATPNAQLSFFAEFLQATGVYESWVSSCPLTYSSPNAPDKRDDLGTWLLAILAGHKRYARITGLRGDAVSPQILGMNKIISEDALRRALSRMSAEQSSTWLVPQLLASVQGALSTPWILDIDTTIKPLYGKQDGAQVSYNPPQARQAQPRATHLLGGQPALGARRGGLTRQRAQRRQSAPGLDGRAGQTHTPAASGSGARRLRFCSEPFIAELESRGQGNLTCGANNAVSHANACGNRQNDGVDHKYLCGFKSCQGSCGAVAEQLPNTDRWRTFLNYVVAKITQPLPPWLPPKKLAGQV